MSIRQQINIEAKEINRQTHPVAFRAHIDDRYYVSVTSGYRLLCEHMRPTCSRLGLRLDEWAHLLDLVPTIYERHLELAIAELSGEETDKIGKTIRSSTLRALAYMFGFCLMTLML